MASNSSDPITFLSKFFANDQGRDKAHKIVQNGARLLANEFKIAGNEELAKRFAGLFAHTRDGRKINRLFNQFKEIQKITTAAKALRSSAQPSKQYLQMINGIGLLGYWHFDNLLYLANAKFVEKNAEWSKISMFAWWVGLTSQLIQDAQLLSQSIIRERKLRHEMRSANAGVSTKLQNELHTLLAARINIYMNLMKTGCDWLVAANGWQMYSRMGFSQLGERTVSISGLLAGTIVCYQVAKSL